MGPPFKSKTFPFFGTREKGRNYYYPGIGVNFGDRGGYTIID